MKSKFLLIILLFIVITVYSQEANNKFKDSLSVIDSYLEKTKEKKQEQEKIVLDDGTVLIVINKDKIKQEEAKSNNLFMNFILNHKNSHNLKYVKRKRSKPSNYGGAGGFGPTILKLDFSPIEKVIASESVEAFPSKDFDFSNNTIIMMGGFGYAGKKNGLRIGVGGWGGFKSYSSSYAGSSLVLDSTEYLTDSTLSFDSSYVNIDSTISLDVIMGYGGLIFDNSFNVGKLNLSFGGLFGGGALVINKEMYKTEDNTIFSVPVDSYDTSDSSDTFDRSNRVGTMNDLAVAPLACFDLHLGASLSLASWLHLGGEVSSLFLYAFDGFGKGTEAFTTRNPLFRFKIIFGNLG